MIILALFGEFNFMKKITLLALFAGVSVLAHAQTFTGGGFSIPDASAAGGSNTITVSNAGTVTSLNWVSVNFTTRHTWVGDLIAEFSNGSTSVHLFSRVGSTTATGVGDSSALSGNYRFFDSGSSLATAAAGVGSGVNIPTGDYARSTHALVGAANSSLGVVQYNANTYSTFNGATLAGNWTLKIWDQASGDTGAVGDWAFNVTATPEPGTMAALGLGAVALIRRRRSN